MCVIRITTRRHPNGRRESIEERQYCTRSVNGRLCDRVKREHSAEQHLVELRPDDTSASGWSRIDADLERARRRLSDRSFPPLDFGSSALAEADYFRHREEVVVVRRRSPRPAARIIEYRPQTSARQPPETESRRSYPPRSEPLPIPRSSRPPTVSPVPLSPPSQGSRSPTARRRPPPLTISQRDSPGARSTPVVVSPGLSRLRDNRPTPTDSAVGSPATQKDEKTAASRSLSDGTSPSPPTAEQYVEAQQARLWRDRAVARAEQRALDRASHHAREARQRESTTSHDSPTSRPGQPRTTIRRYRYSSDSQSSPTMSRDRPGSIHRTYTYRTPDETYAMAARARRDSGRMQEALDRWSLDDDYDNSDIFGGEFDTGSYDRDTRRRYRREDHPSERRRGFF